MSFECSRLDAVLEEGDPEALEEARAHGKTCARCREELEAWDAISRNAPALNRAWQTPTLWPRIARAIEREREGREARRRAARWLLPAAAAAALLAGFGLWRGRGLAPQDPGRALLSERTLEEVERSETAYAASIDRLAKLAEPRIATPDTPLLASYREKLQVLDAAIADCKAEVERNRFNAQLRQELLSIYRDKEHTLEQILGERT